MRFLRFWSTLFPQCISGTFPKEQCVDDSDLKKKCFGIVIQAHDGDNDDDTGDEISVNFEYSPLRADARYGISKPQASRIKYALMIIFILDVVLKW